MLGAAALAAQSSTLPRPTKDFTIGCADCEGALQFTSFHELAIAPNGEILVVDKDEPMLRRFDGNGRPIWSGGKRGRGPGEYQYVLRAVFTPALGLDLVDLAGMRLTTLGADGAVVSTLQLQVFPTTASGDGRGTILLGAELPLGGLRVFRVREGQSTAVAIPDLPRPADGVVFRSSSVALSPSGVIAIAPHSERYQIVQLDSAGQRLADITRPIERVRRTPAEEAALRATINGEMAVMRAAVERSTGRASSSAPQPIATANLTLKPHLAVDGLRYDGAGRLWARTMRGDEAHTVFDIFAPTGEFLGEVTLDGVIQQFALAGRWLVTSGEDADGVPQVTRWTLRD